MASRFWVGGTGTWDASDTTHWAATSNGAGGQSVPGSADTVTLDGSSGGGTVTVNTTVTVQSITCGAFTGTLDFSANDNNVTVTASGGVSISGSGTRTINLGDGTWTFTAPAVWAAGTTSNLTFNANASTMVFSGATASSRSFTSSGAGLTYNAVTIAANASGGLFTFAGLNTIATLSITGQNYVTFPGATTTTITNAFTLSGNTTSPLGVFSDSGAANATLSCASGTCRFYNTALRRMTGAGGATFLGLNAVDLGLNSNITLTPMPGQRSRSQLGM